VSSIYSGLPGGRGLATAAFCAACTPLAIQASFVSENTLSAAASIGQGGLRSTVGCAGDFENLIRGGHLVGTPPPVELIDSGGIGVLPDSAEQLLGCIGPLHLRLLLVRLQWVLVSCACNHAAD
jgi:hypothetical protein